MEISGRVPPEYSRRAILGSAAAGIAATSGCMERLRTLAGQQQPPQISLTIKSRPVDEDPYAMHIARTLNGWFGTAGIDSTVEPLTAEELYRQVLLGHEFEAFVGRYPYRSLGPDSLYSFLHSSFVAERGWQNPFGFTNLEIDDLLTAQRDQTGSNRTETVETLQQKLAEECAFIVLGFPDVIRTANSTRFTGWTNALGQSPLGLLSLHRRDPSARTLRLATTDGRVTTNLNPLMAPFRRRGRITDLIFDSLARRYRGTLDPWVATDWEWVDTGRATPRLRVSLRDDVTWHDGEPLTAADVAFTYEMLADTSLGEFDQAVPPTRYRGRSTIVSDSTVIDDRTIGLSCEDCSEAVAERALTVPLLAEHIWRPLASSAELGGIDIGAQTTEALVTDMIPPVGSGPLRFESASENESLELAVFQDHFINEGTTGIPADTELGVPFETVTISTVGSDSTAVELARTGDVDATAVGVRPSQVRTIGRADDLTLLLDRSDAFYFVGFNTRNAPLGSPRFRNLLSHLIDREHLVDSIFHGYATPAVSPLEPTEWVPKTLEWENGGAVTPFLGSDGQLDTELVRTTFKDAGYRYGEEGELLQP